MFKFISTVLLLAFNIGLFGQNTTNIDAKFDIPQRSETEIIKNFDHKSPALNTKSGKNILSVSDKAIEKSSVLVTPTPTLVVETIVTTTPPISPTPSPTLTPTPLPKPSITIIPQPTLYPCPPPPCPIYKTGPKKEILEVNCPYYSDKEPDHYICAF